MTEIAVGLAGFLVVTVGVFVFARRLGKHEGYCLGKDEGYCLGKEDGHRIGDAEGFNRGYRIFFSELRLMPIPKYAEKVRWPLSKGAQIAATICLMWGALEISSKTEVLITLDHAIASPQELAAYLLTVLKLIPLDHGISALLGS
ncbi:MAG TPA: hypothetical protein VKB38_18085 [Terracidiphilus sp.]|nr:hypothetical protein [Terracidiphilus sp.]